MHIVDVNNLVKRYKEVVALDHFDLHIEPGEVFGLLGPNPAAARRPLSTVSCSCSPTTKARSNCSGKR